MITEQQEVTTGSIIRAITGILQRMESNEISQQKAEAYFKGVKQINVARAHDVNVQRNELKARQLDLLDRAITVKEGNPKLIENEKEN